MPRIDRIVAGVSGRPGNLSALRYAADLAGPDAAGHIAAPGPDDQRGAVPAGRADQDRARSPPHDQRLGRDIRREPAERHIQSVPEPPPGVLLPLADHRVGGELPGRTSDHAG